MNLEIRDCNNCRHHSQGELTATCVRCIRSLPPDLPEWEPEFELGPIEVEVDQKGEEPDLIMAGGPDVRDERAEESDEPLTWNQEEAASKGGGLTGSTPAACADDMKKLLRELSHPSGAVEERLVYRESDSVSHPPHYTAHPSGVECIQITEHMNFCVGNAMKYLWRAGLKGDRTEDLRKAQWYIQRELERLGHGT